MRRLRSTAHWSDPRVKPPYGAAEIDWNHSLSRSLVFSTLLNESGGRPADKNSQAVGIKLGSTPAQWTVTNRGAAMKGQTTTSGNGIEFGSPAVSADVTLQSAASIAALVLLTQSDRTQVWSRWTVGGVGWQYGDINANGWLGINQAFTGSNGLIASATAPSLNIPTMCVAAWNPTNNTASDISLFHNGVLQSHSFDNNGTNGSLFSDVTGKVEMFASLGGYNGYSGTNANIAVFIWKNRRLLASDALWLTAEPYAMFRPIIRRRYFIAAAGAAAPDTFIQQHIGRAIGRGILVGR